jgi:hypothetical protein
VRILLAIHNAYTDSESGAAHSIRILMRWLAEAGHECRVLCTARFDARAPGSTHLSGLGVEITRRRRSAIHPVGAKPANVAVGRPPPIYSGGAPVTMLLTKHNDPARPDRLESEQFLFLLDRELRDFLPDVVLSYGGHPVLPEAMRRARAGGAVTVFTLRNHGYEDRRHYEHVDHVFTTSPYLSEQYRRRIGLASTGIPSPIDWAEVLAPEAERRFVTFVNPSAHKGAGVFARIADLLGSERPDIPILVVQSASSAGVLNAIPGIDFAKYPQILAAPPLPKPADFFALTKLLLSLPSSTSRSAASPPGDGQRHSSLVSGRGGLPETVEGAGRSVATARAAHRPSLESRRRRVRAGSERCAGSRRPEEVRRGLRLARRRGQLYGGGLRKRYWIISGAAGGSGVVGRSLKKRHSLRSSRRCGRQALPYDAPRASGVVGMKFRVDSLSTAGKIGGRTRTVVRLSEQGGEMEKGNQIKTVICGVALVALASVPVATAQTNPCTGSGFSGGVCNRFDSTHETNKYQFGDHFIKFTVDVVTPFDLNVEASRS